MSLKDFNNHFDSIAVCKINGTYKYSSITIIADKNKQVSFELVKFNISQKCHICLSINQHDDRMFEESDEEGFSDSNSNDRELMSGSDTEDDSDSEE